LVGCLSLDPPVYVYSPVVAFARAGFAATSLDDLAQPDPGRAADRIRQALAGVISAAQ
jgi:hypothetical protein